jgi:hypothetical protein
MTRFGMMTVAAVVGLGAAGLYGWMMKNAASPPTPAPVCECAKAKAKAVKPKREDQR